MTNPSMIGKTYRTEHGMPVRVVALHTFEGVEYAFAEALRIGGGLADMTAVETSSLAPIDASVFDTELAKVRKQAAAKAKDAAAREEGERYGITITVMGRSHKRLGQATIVRCTATRWVSVDGTAYIRKPGKSYKNGTRVGSGSWDWSSITAEGLKALQDFAGDRERVDIVAERKAAALREPGEVTP